MSPACPCCGSAGGVDLGRLQDVAWFAGTRLAHPLPGGRLYRCDRCRLAFRHPVQDASAYARLYDNEVTGNWAAHGDRPDWTLIVATLRRLRPQAARVLDFGCYTGGLLARLGATPQRFGVEISRGAAEQARQHSGATVWASLEDIPPDLRFDAILAADVVEHLPDPRALVERLLPLLADRGILIVTTGDAGAPPLRWFGANWWYCYYPEHIAFLSRPWLHWFAANSGAVLLETANFAYRRLGATRRAVDALGMVAYGLLPRAFLGLKKSLQRLRGQDSLPGVPGNGVSADHLLAVLARDPNR